MTKIVMVTGVAGGIGSATAAAFGKEGWYVVGIDKRYPPYDVAVDRFLCVDLTVPADIDAAFRELANLGHVNALVNNAAVQITKLLIETTPEEWDMVMAANVRSVYLTIRAAYPLLRACAGAIINTSSVHALATSSGIAAYAASKGALLALTRAAALELAKDGIRVNAVLPGAVDTPMLRAGLSRRPEEGEREDGMRALAVRTPLGRVAQPDEIAQAILFLADEARSRFITGQAFVVDGGATARLSTE